MFSVSVQSIYINGNNKPITIGTQASGFGMYYADFSANKGDIITVNQISGYSESFTYALFINEGKEV